MLQQNINSFVFYMHNLIPSPVAEADKIVAKELSTLAFWIVCVCVCTYTSNEGPRIVSLE